MKAITVFEFADMKLRAFVKEDGQRMYFATDVLACLGLKNVTQALRYLDDNEKDKITFLNGETEHKEGATDSVENSPESGDIPRTYIVVTKAGLTRLVHKSRRPQASVWRRWLEESGDPSKLEAFITSCLAPVQASWVYFIEAPESHLIKIGYTTDIFKRLAGLQTMSPVPLRLRGRFLGTRDDEHRLHEQFDYLRSHGEWFRSDPSLINTILTLCTKEATNGKLN